MTHSSILKVTCHLCHPTSSWSLPWTSEAEEQPGAPGAERRAGAAPCPAAPGRQHGPAASAALPEAEEREGADSRPCRHVFRKLHAEMQRQPRQQHGEMEQTPFVLGVPGNGARLQGLQGPTGQPEGRRLNICSKRT